MLKKRNLAERMRFQVPTAVTTKNSNVVRYGKYVNLLTFGRTYCLKYSSTLNTEAVTFLRIFGKYLPDYTTSHFTRQFSSPEGVPLARHIVFRFCISQKSPRHVSCNSGTIRSRDNAVLGDIVPLCISYR